MNVLEKIYKLGKEILEIYKVYKVIFYIVLTCLLPFVFMIYKDDHKFYLALIICLLILWVLVFTILNQNKVSSIHSSKESKFFLPKYESRKLYIFILSLVVAFGLIFSTYKLYQKSEMDKNKIVVLIIPFKNETDSTRDIFSTKLYGELNEQLDTDKSINVELLETPISESAGGITKAKAIAKERKASILIWGSYSKSLTNIYLKTKFEILDSTMQNIKPDIYIQNEKNVFKIDQLNSFELQTEITNSNSFLIFSCLGYLKYIQFKWSAAITYFNKALNFSSNDINRSTVSFFKGNCFYQSKDIDSATYYFKQAVKYNKKYVPPYIGMGVIFSKNNQFELAFECYNTALYYNPDDIMAYNDLGVLYMKTHQYDLAEKSFAHAFTIFPGDTTSFKNTETFYKMRDRYEHDVEINEKSKNLKKLYFALIRRASYYYWSKLYQQAIADVDTCIKMAPDSVNLYILKGDIEDDSGDKKELALKDYAYALKLSPRNYMIYYESAVIYKRLGKLKLALQDYNKSISIRPTAEAYNIRADIYMTWKMYKKGYDDFKAAYTISTPIDSSSYADHMRMAMYYLRNDLKHVHHQSQ